MDGRKDTLNDAALEQEIEALLSGEPSPDFVARVRSRVAEEPMSRSGGYSWRWAIVTAATGAVMIGVSLTWPHTRVEPVPTTTWSHPVPEATQVDAGSASERVPVVHTDRAITRRADRQPVGIGAPLPEVVIPDEEKRGFEILLDELRDPKDSAIVARAVSGRDTPGPPWLDVQPVIIEPLRDVAFQGEGQ